MLITRAAALAYIQWKESLVHTPPKRLTIDVLSLEEAKCGTMSAIGCSQFDRHFPSIECYSNSCEQTRVTYEHSHSSYLACA